MLVMTGKPKKSNEKEQFIAELINQVDQQYLIDAIKKISIPRHALAERKNNQVVAAWIESELNSFGCKTFRQGQFNNIVGSLNDDFSEVKILIGAHYDCVPNSPGADDNASAIVGMLAVAKVLAKVGNLPVAFVAFNQEEDGLLGSKDFVANYLPTTNAQLNLVHILEMIGYCDHSAGSQRLPKGLPIKLSDTGDFIAIIANKHSNNYLSPLLATATQYTPDLSVKALKLFMGVETLFPHLLRSDHAPFWSSQIPALMWTDTSEFRNPNYHRLTDKPDTLDYPFMRATIQLILAQILNQLKMTKQC